MLASEKQTPGNVKVTHYLLSSLSVRVCLILTLHKPIKESVLLEQLSTKIRQVQVVFTTLQAVRLQLE